MTIRQRRLFAAFGLLALAAAGTAADTASAHPAAPAADPVRDLELLAGANGDSPNASLSSLPRNDAAPTIAMR